MRRELIGLLLLLCALGGVPLLGNDYWTGIGFNLLMWIGLASAWALFSALTGFISLGHVVFFGLGTYSTVLLWEHLPLWVALPLSGLAAAGFALVIGLPVLRIRGPYFVILTLGIAELVKNVVLMGESALGQASRILLGAPSMDVLFYWMLAGAATALAAGYFVRKRPRWWLGLRALRANEEAAETVGVPVARMKLITLVMSAFIVGAIGGVAALRSTYFEAGQAFDPMISFTMIAMTIIGGGDSLKGPVLGAIGLTLLQEVLWVNLPELYTVILGILLALFVLFVPGGLSGWLSRLSMKLGRKECPGAVAQVSEAGGHQ
ncbi:branched-chain amino acid ABC transporter permease [Variovorax sp. SRS16]|uniref:branched-chain amino acid ABC transporter permease n=1 Tax=Variovorax sp. SRS16 TaxID=282217 RepID=UPI0013A5BC51|nr:branched-chain amino acid ABC transporter permease [Variovorax sp. SRS16]